MTIHPVKSGFAVNYEWSLSPFFLYRFYRRGWITFERSVNIKEICWDLNNIRVCIDLSYLGARGGGCDRHFAALRGHTKKIARRGWQCLFLIINGSLREFGVHCACIFFTFFLY
jgi:hypothetical protein